MVEEVDLLEMEGETIKDRTQAEEITGMVILEVFFWWI